MDDCFRHPPDIGGPNKEVEIDETEVGVRRKGVRGRPANVKLDVWGCVERESGKVWFELFKKETAAGSGRHRFGPAKATEVLPLVTKCVRPGSIIMSDGLAAYKRNIIKMGYRHHYVSHQDGEYAKRTDSFYGVVHINTIEGIWGNYKNFLRAKKGVKTHRHPLYLYEFMWRHNTKITNPDSSIFHEILKLMSRL